MDWVILIVVIPLILTPIVLLFGFAGCGSLLEHTPTPQKPTLTLAATVEGTKRISLSWTDTTTNPAGYEVWRGETTPSKSVKSLPGNEKTYADETGLTEGSTYSYQVKESSGQLESNIVSRVTWPEAPTINSVTALSPEKLQVKWTNNSLNQTGFEIVASGVPDPPDPPPLGKADTEYTFETLKEGTDYSITLVALAGSARSLPATANKKTPAWVISHPARPVTSTRNFKSSCLVQRINAVGQGVPNFVKGGPKVRLTLRGPATTQVEFSHIFVSLPQPPGVGHEWDSSPGSLKRGWPELLQPNVTKKIAAGMVDQVVVDFNLDENKDLLISFNIIGDVAGPVAAVNGATAYVRDNDNPPQAGEEDRTAGFNKYPGELCFVEKIEVMSG